MQELHTLILRALHGVQYGFRDEVFPGSLMHSPGTQAVQTCVQGSVSPFVFVVRRRVSPSTYNEVTELVGADHDSQIWCIC